MPNGRETESTKADRAETIEPPKKQRRRRKSISALKAEISSALIDANQGELLYVVSAQGIVLNVSAQFCHDTGYSKQELIGGPCTTFLVTKEPSVDTAQTKALLQIQKSVLKRKDGAQLVFFSKKLRVPTTTVAASATTTSKTVKNVQRLDNGLSEHFVVILFEHNCEKVPLPPTDYMRLFLPKSVQKHLKQQQYKSLVMPEAPSYVENYQGTVGFVDLIKFTQSVAEYSAQDGSDILQQYYGFFDTMCSEYKLQTIQGSALRYTFFSRNTKHVDAHAVNSVLLATGLINNLQKFEAKLQNTFSIKLRIGIASGTIRCSFFCLNGRRCNYCVWGETVNAASTLTTLAPSNGVLVSKSTYKMAKYYENLFFEGPVVSTKVKALQNFSMYSAWFSNSVRRCTDDSDSSANYTKFKDASTATVSQPLDSVSRCDNNDEDVMLFPNTHILIVDDVKVNNIVLAKMLEPYKCQVTACDNSQEVLELMETGISFDLCIFDVRMPELDGIELTKLVRQTWSSKQLPIVGLTSLNDIDSLTNCCDAGMNDVLYKPLDSVRLRALVCRWLMNKRS